MKNRFVHYAAVLGIIAAVSAGILGGVNNATSKVIQANNMKMENDARVKVLPLAASFDESKAIEAQGMKFIPGVNASGEIVGYVVKSAQPGYAADIDFVLGIDKSGKVTGLNILGSQETPGLGAKIMDEEWQKKAIGKDASYEFNKSTDAFAGATISPRAVYTGIKRVLDCYNSEVNK